MKYLLGSGFFGHDHAFAQLRAENLVRHIKTIPSELVTISVGRSMPPPISRIFQLAEWPELQVVQLSGNARHVGALLNGKVNYQLCGWTSGVLALAMLAYSNESDMVYIEQDCLIKGDVVERMYSELGSKRMIFGPPMKKPPFMSCSQSVFLVKHSFIPTLVHDLIFHGSDKHTLPEAKFSRLMDEHPEDVATYSFGFDREKPIQWEDEVWAAQKLSADEIEEAKRRAIV